MHPTHHLFLNIFEIVPFGNPQPSDYNGIDTYDKHVPVTQSHHSLSLQPPSSTTHHPPLHHTRPSPAHISLYYGTRLLSTPPSISCTLPAIYNSTTSINSLSSSPPHLSTPQSSTPLYHMCPSYKHPISHSSNYRFTPPPRHPHHLLSPSYYPSSLPVSFNLSDHSL